jgi:hypothetical protein
VSVASTRVNRHGARTERLHLSRFAVVVAQILAIRIASLRASKGPERNGSIGVADGGRKSANRSTDHLRNNYSKDAFILPHLLVGFVDFIVPC